MAEPKSKAPEGVPLRLKHDTWKGEERIVADGQVSYWPLEQARALTETGVAHRADPLPGDTAAPAVVETDA